MEERKVPKTVKRERRKNIYLYMNKKIVHKLTLDKCTNSVSNVWNKFLVIAVIIQLSLETKLLSF